MWVRRFNEADELKQRQIALATITLLRLLKFRDMVASNGRVPQDVRDAAPLTNTDFIVKSMCIMALPGMYSKEKPYESYINELDAFLNSSEKMK